MLSVFKVDLMSFLSFQLETIYDIILAPASSEGIPKICDPLLNVVCRFRWTYKCLQSFSALKLTKDKNFAGLTDLNLNGLIDDSAKN